MSRFECIESFHLPLNDIEGVPSEYLKDSVWDSPEFACKELSENERLDLLNNIERVQAGLQRREPLTVELEDLPKEALGYQDEYNKKIVLNRSCVMTDHPYYHRQTIDTVVHEGRHAYQHYNVEVRTVHESDAEVASWRENFFNPEYGYYQSRGQKIYIPLGNGGFQEMADFRLYRYQPVEIDARNFATDVISKLDKKGLFVSSNK